ncbi:hypothetical protein IEQ34_011927 [Dendrobium chrysotoxum]|uniref:Uncharacterized protein n=1 Tax=Dendrobium chrysotoxum TaxID=161865 RepID=A0AAV7GTQ3_DENCH|nr:hypothetical protein IEQ34_011927 [Dendrobium chrysotoxum]
MPRVLIKSSDEVFPPGSGEELRPIPELQRRLGQTPGGAGTIGCLNPLPPIGRRGSGCAPARPRSDEAAAAAFIEHEICLLWQAFVVARSVLRRVH